MMRRFLLLLLALCCLLLPALANDTVVTDSTLALQEDTVQDILTLNRRLEDAAEVSLAVVTRHFLDGGQPQPVADALRAGRDDAEDTILLLLVLGEERYAVSVGVHAARLLPGETLDSLITARLAPPFAARAYDQAVGDFLVGVARQIAAASGESINTQDLFGAQPAPAATSTPENDTNPVTEWLERVIPREYKTEEGGRTALNIGRIAFVVIALYFVFGRGDRKGRRGGCSSLIWLLVILSIAGGAGFFK